MLTHPNSIAGAQKDSEVRESVDSAEALDSKDVGRAYVENAPDLIPRALRMAT